jgi:chemotaxis protein CheX
MVTTGAVLPSAADLSEAVDIIAAQVWESLFDAVAVPAAPVDESTFGPDGMTASVGVYGDWQVTVTLTCSATVGREMTRHMLALSESDDVDPLDLEDALSEVVNIVGGNVKSLVDGCTLGLPSAGRVAPGLRPVLAVLHVAWGPSVVRLGIHDHEHQQHENLQHENLQRGERP